MPSKKITKKGRVRVQAYVSRGAYARLVECANDEGLESLKDVIEVLSRMKWKLLPQNFENIEPPAPPPKRVPWVPPPPPEIIPPGLRAVPTPAPHPGSIIAPLPDLRDPMDSDAPPEIRRLATALSNSHPLTPTEKQTLRAWMLQEPPPPSEVPVRVPTRETVVAAAPSPPPPVLEPPPASPPPPALVPRDHRDPAAPEWVRRVVDELASGIDDHLDLLKAWRRGEAVEAPVEIE